MPVCVVPFSDMHWDAEHVEINRTATGHCRFETICRNFPIGDYTTTAGFRSGPATFAGRRFDNESTVDCSDHLVAGNVLRKRRDGTSRWRF